MPRTRRPNEFTGIGRPLRKARPEKEYWRQKARTLEYESVPHAFCEALEKRGFPRMSEEFKYAFRFISHLLAYPVRSHHTARGHGVRARVRMYAFAGTSSSTQVAKWTNLMVDHGILEETTPAVRGVTTTLFRIAKPLWDSWQGSANSRRYRQPSEFTNYRPGCQAVPVEKLDSTLDRLSDQALKNIVRELQQRPLLCDLKSLKSHVLSLPTEKQQSWAPMVQALYDGPNYARYKASESRRLYTSRPSLQNVPKDLRRWFYPKEGRVFLDFDYKTQESWIVAHLSSDAKLLARLRSNKMDLYQFIAAGTGLSRDQAKGLYNAFNYGAGSRTMARQAFEPDGQAEPSDDQVAIAEGIRLQLLTLFPDAALWVDKTTQQIRRAGGSFTQGRKWRAIDPAEARTKGVNHLVQGTAAEMLHTILFRLDARLNGRGRLLLPIHDGLLVEVSEDAVDWVTEMVCEVMHEASRYHLNGLEIPVTFQRGWRSKSLSPEEANLRPA